MKKAKERLDAEAAHPQTKKQKWQNFWFYHRTHVIVGVCAVLLVGLFIKDIVTQVKPDYQLAILTNGYVMEEQRVALEETFTAMLDDRNGDGKIAGTVLVYNMPLPGEDPADPNSHMANMTRFSADLQMGESMIFLTNHPVAYQESFQAFQYTDGSTPPEEGTPDDARLGVPFANCAGLADVAQLQPLEDFRLVMRSVYPEVVERKPEMGEYHAASLAIYDKLVSGK